MRVAVVLAVALIAACASEKLAVSPPVGVDLSGHWQLNAADSDDPMRLLQSQLTGATAGAGPGGSASRASHPSHGGPAGPMGPPIPSVSVLDEALRWPAKELAITQSGGSVSFASHDRTDVCRPSDAGSHPPAKGDSPPRSGRGVPSHGRGDAPPPVCGWEGKTLVVQSADPEEEHPLFTRTFSLSEDRQRLIELVRFRSGFVASRVWDRAPQP